MSIENGDKVIYPECFGNSVMVFVGMAHNLNFNNDCVVLRNGEAVPVKYSGLVKVEDQNTTEG